MVSTVSRDLVVLSGFRRELYGCLTGRGDELFELAEAVLCTDGPVKTLVELALAPEHRRGHGALYAGLNQGVVDVARLRWSLAALPLPRAADGRIVLAADVTPWLRPDAVTSPQRLFCHTYGRGRGKAEMIPGWPYSVIAALERGATSWTAVLDAQRLGPDDDVAETTAAQVRGLVERLTGSGQRGPGDPDIWLVLDAGYDLARLTYLLTGLPVTVLGRLRSDRVFYRPAPPRLPGKPGPTVKHGDVFAFTDPATWHDPDHETTTATTRYGHATATAWGHLHPRLTRRAAWADHNDTLPVLPGTVIRLQVDHLPGDRHPKPLWLWYSTTTQTDTQIDLLWQAYLRRFDLEHTFRLWKQTLGWTAPKLRNPEAADRWTWLIIAVHTQLRLARPLATDLRRPWERPAPPSRLTPARVRRGFRNLRPKTPLPASAPKPTKPGPGRPPGSKNQKPAPRHNPGKTTNPTPQG